jgi:hypothetical protein
MSYPDFFEHAPSIVMHDALAELLGACDDGLMTYRYVDAVRLAGHSCPTVAGAFLMTRRALALLYPQTVPERGAIRVWFSSALDEGVTGVMASVVGLITGAAGAGGFKGIGDRFRRQDLMRFGIDADAEACFERIDTGTSVRLTTRLHRVPAEPHMGVLLKAILAGSASADEAREFAALWQERVRRILIDHADDPELIVQVFPG